MAAINESPSEDAVRSRGNVLALLGGAIAGAVAGALGRPGRALAGHDGTNVFHLEELNTTDATTDLEANMDFVPLRIRNFNEETTAGAMWVLSSNPGDDGVPTIRIDNLASGGIALGGTSTTPDFGNGDGIGVAGGSGSGRGVLGGAVSGTGVWGQTETGDGVHGFASESGKGVVGESANGVAVHGNSLHGIAVWGLSEGDGIGGQFNNPNGIGLAVTGRARFSTAGAGTVPQGQNSVFVANSAVTADSHISVTLVGNPGIRALHWVQRSPGSGFTVRLTPAPTNQRPATAFTYLVVEAAA